MSSKQAKKTPSSVRAGSASNKEAASIAASVVGQDSKRPKFTIWPEWSDADINAEKWDGAHKGKEKDKGKSPVVQHFFDDPEGRNEFPWFDKITQWKRPHEFISDKTPVVVDPDHMTSFDLMSSNEACHESELMRWITSQISAVWRINSVPLAGSAPCGAQHAPPSVAAHTPAVTSATAADLDPSIPRDHQHAYMWRPWELIYAINKVGKSPNMPFYNPHGKYVVKLYWMGSWRKIVVDDSMPFNADDNLLVPSTSNKHELWPMLLTKALIKIASLDHMGGSSGVEFGDFSVVQCLTGWIPEAIPLHYGHLNEIWELLKNSLTEFKLPEPGSEPTTVTPESNQQETLKEEKVAEVNKSVNETKSVSRDSKDKKEKGKEEKKDKKDKDKGKEKSMVQDEFVMPDHPEIAVFASYSGPPAYPVRVSLLSEMADASERLRQMNMSHLYPHPVLLNQTRSCPLVAPPVPEKLPAWKLIRPRKKKNAPSDEPVETPEEKPIQCVEIISPFVNYKVSPVSIPTDVKRPKSSLERGSSHSRPSTAAIQETDENQEKLVPAGTTDPSATAATKPAPVSSKVEIISAEQESKDIKKKSSNSQAKLTVKEQDETSSKNDSRTPSARKPEKQKTTGAANSSVTGASGVNSRSRINSSSSLESKPAKEGKTKSETKAGAGVGGGSRLDIHSANLTSEQQSNSAEKTVLSPSAAEGVTGSEECGEQVDSQPTTNLWMDYNVFCKCFKTLYIFHKPNTYPMNCKHSDLKAVMSSSKDKKTTPNTASTSMQGADEKSSPQFLFVDSLKPTEIVVSFSALSRWNDPPTPVTREDSKQQNARSGGRERGESKADVLTADSLSMVEEPKESEFQQNKPQPGLLVAEPYSWKSLVAGQPLLRLRTTGCRAAVLTLSEGRHVLRFSMSAAFGYSVQLCSTTAFVFGDEQKVMAELIKESCRFVESASHLIGRLGACINSFNDAEAYKKTWQEFVLSHCPYPVQKHLTRQYHFKVFNEAFYTMLRKVLAEGQMINAETQFAFRAFNMDATSRNILGIPVGSNSRPGDQQEPVTIRTDPWANREISPEDHVAAIKIQKVWRGFWVRKIKKARLHGEELNLSVQGTLQKALAAIESSPEQNGLYLYRSLFKIDSDLMSLYPFYKDEWNKISYDDYQGSHPDQASDSWFLLFREVFYVSEEMLCVPKLYVPLPTAMLRVINNDNWQEMPRVFQKVAPHVYKKNKRGYTLVAEARTVDHALQAGRWRLRLIGSLSPLPQPMRNEVNSSFHVREIRDYYVPNKKNIIFRQSVKVCEDHLVSIQVHTSRPEVYLRLSVLDHGEEQTSVVGRGHVVLPAFIFLKDRDAASIAAAATPLISVEDESSKRSGSRTSNKGGSKLHGSSSQHNVTSKSKTRSGSATQPGHDSRNSARQSLSSLEIEEDEKDAKPHKYIIQAVVLQDSWPLSESSWAFVQNLKEVEKNDLKVLNREKGSSPPPPTTRSEKASSAAGKAGGKGKEKGKAGKDKGSRPPSQQFDFTKPYFTLRVVSDGATADEIDVRKDTERADEIRAMKRAWEQAEPGRAAKALQCRLDYLNSHLVRAQPDLTASTDVITEPDAAGAADEGSPPAAALSGDTAGGTAPPRAPATRAGSTTSPSLLLGLDALDQDTTLTLEPPPAPPPTEILPAIDKTPFMRSYGGPVRYRDEKEVRRQTERKQHEIAEYREYRERVEAWREQDRLKRNEAKRQQIELYERLQARTDACREEVNGPREAFRQRFLEAERRRIQEEQEREAAAAAAAAEQVKTPASPKGRKSAKDKKGSAGKKKK